MQFILNGLTVKTNYGEINAAERFSLIIFLTYLITLIYYI